MAIQKYIMKNRKFANFFMSHLPASAHEKKAKKYAVMVAQNVIKRVRAYQKFLKDNNTKPEDIKTFEDFKKLPITDKKNYIDYKKYSIKELALDGRFTNAYTIEKSSGHSGKSYYWLRMPEEDSMFPSYLEFAFAQFYHMDKKRTLVLITLALGTWTSGEKMAQALREVAATGKYPLTVMTPGTNIDEILEIIGDIADNYDQTIMVGYPPFIKTVIDQGIEKGMDWKKYNMKIGLGGEGYSEEWRNHIAEKIGVNPDKDLLAISGGYGAADVGMSVGREYPLTVIIRRLCQKDKKLAKELFFNNKNGSTLPSLLQYSPGSVFIEEIKGELVFTALTGIPIVRYNIHDRGGVIGFEKMMNTLKNFGYDPYDLIEKRGYTKNDIWKMPFFYCFGRSDGTISIVGANIYPENIEVVLNEAHDTDIIGYKIAVETSDTFQQRPLVLLEHKKDSLGESETAELIAEFYEIITKGLKRINPDFKDAHDDNPHAADPIIQIYANGCGPFEGDKKKIKRKYSL